MNNPLRALSRRFVGWAGADSSAPADSMIMQDAPADAGKAIPTTMQPRTSAGDDALQRVSAAWWSTGSGAGMIRTAYDVINLVNGWAYTALNKRALAGSGLNVWAKESSPTPDPRELVALTESSYSWWLQMLIDRPYPRLRHWTWEEILYRIWFDRDAFGVAVLYTPKLGGMWPARMMMLPPSQVYPRSLTGVGIDYYDWHSDSGTVQLPADEVCYMPRLGERPNIYESLVGGESLILKGIDFLRVGQGATGFLRNAFQYGIMPQYLLKIPQMRIGGGADRGEDGEEKAAKISSADIQTMIDRWLQRQAGQQGRVPIGSIPAEWELQELAPIQQSFDAMLSASDRAKGDFFEVCGISRTYIDQTGSTYANAQVMKWQFQSETISPEARRIHTQLTQHFNQYLIKGARAIVIGYDPHIYEDKEQERNQEKHDLDNGIISIDDARQKRGLLPIEGGAEPTIVAGRIPLRLIGAAPIMQPALPVNLTATPEAKAMLSRLFAENSMPDDDDTTKGAEVDPDPFPTRHSGPSTG